MNLQQKLQIIQKRLDLTQTEMANKVGVSFVAYNNWWNDKSKPRKKYLEIIEDLFLEVTGEKIIAEDILKEKRVELDRRTAKHKNVLSEILKNKDIFDEFVLKLTYHSNSIEGSTLTEPDTAAILFDNVSLPNKTLNEQLEAKNHQTALNYLFDFLFNKGVIDEKLVLKLHSILMNGVIPNAGAYRNHGVRITGVNLPTANYMKIPELIKELFTKLDKEKDIVKDLARVHAEFERIHPFSDGNGRVGRLLMTAMLIGSNLPPAVILQQQKQLYYTYLYKAQSKNDLSQLENFLYQAISLGFDILDRKDIG